MPRGRVATCTCARETRKRKKKRSERRPVRPFAATTAFFSAQRRSSRPSSPRLFPLLPTGSAHGPTSCRQRGSQQEPKLRFFCVFFPFSLCSEQRTFYYNPLLKGAWCALHFFLSRFEATVSEAVISLVEDIDLEPDKKRIRPCDIGGLAGGQKFLHKNVFFKFAFDHFGMYDGDDQVSFVFALPRMFGKKILTKK